MCIFRRGNAPPVSITIASNRRPYGDDHESESPSHLTIVGVFAIPAIFPAFGEDAPSEPGKLESVSVQYAGAGSFQSTLPSILERGGGRTSDCDKATPVWTKDLRPSVRL
jgi:hypothetical protein